MVVETCEANRFFWDSRGQVEPDELEAAAREIAKRFRAKLKVTTGDDLLKKNFPMTA